MGKKFTIANLIPDENYALQVRAVDNGDASNWSNKEMFKTINDTQQNGPLSPPSVPVATTLREWYTSPAGFTAVWDAIVVTVGGHVTVTSHYDMEFVDSISGVTYMWKFYTSQRPSVTITLSLDTMKTFFGGMPGLVTLRVRAVNSTGNVGEWSNALSASMGIPDPPTNAVVVEAVDQLRISWTPPVNMNYVDGYKVYTGATAGFVPSAANLVYHGAAPVFAHTTATYSLQYFKIRSWSVSGTESSPDLVASGTPKSPFTIDAVPPGVPALSGALSDSSLLPRYADLTWTFNAGTPGNEDIAGFVVAWRKTSSPAETVWRQDFASEERRDMRVELPLPFADYEFKIASYDAVGNYSAYSTPVLSLGGAIPGAPAQVTGVTSTASLDTLRLTWNANTESDVVYGGVYDVDVATNNSFTTGLLSYTTGNTELEVIGLAPNTTYYYRVRAQDVGGTEGPYSTTGSRAMADFPATKSDGAAPSASPTVTLVSGVGYMTALWNRIANNDLVTYEVHISTSTGFTPGAGTLLTETTGTSTIIRTNASKVALAYGTTYYVKVIAKDADGAAAASAQASGTIAQAINADIADVSFGKVTTGSVDSQTFTIAPGGLLTTANGDTTITGTGITVGGSSSISAAAMQAGTAFVDDLGVQSTFTISSSGNIKSSNYVAGTSGFQLSATGLDIRSGTVAAGTLVAGTISSPGISMGAGGVMTIDSTGMIRSTTYTPGVTGWKLSNTGIEMNDANSSISAAAIKTSTLGAVTLTIGSGGAIRSSNFNGTNQGFQLDNQGLVLYTGTIKGTAVYTNQLASLTTDPNSPLPPLAGETQGPSFGINPAGKAVLSGALIYGNTVLGTGAAHLVQSGNYVAGTQGWLLRGDGYADIANLQVYGNSKVGGQLSSITQPGWIINSNGSSSFNNPSMILGNQAQGTIWMVANGNRGEIRLYPPGNTPGVSSYFNYIYGGANYWGYNVLDIRGAAGGAVGLHDAVFVTAVGWVNNIVHISQNANISNQLYVDGYVRFNQNFDVAGRIYCPNWIDTPGIRGDPSFSHMNPGAARLVQVGVGGRISPSSQAPASSIRYKQDIEDWNVSKEAILSMRPITYAWKRPEPVDEPRIPGFIAEEVEALGLGLFVQHDPQNGGRVEGFDYPRFTAALLAVAKEQQTEIDDLRTRIEALEA